MKQKIEIELDIPEGDEVVSVSHCKPGDGSKWMRLDRFVILRPIERWRPAEPNDLKDGPVDMRVRDREDDQWESRMIHTFRNKIGSPFHWIDTANGRWIEAEIRDV